VRSLCVALIAATACGRVGFDARIGPCVASSTAPDPIALGGEAFTFTNFNNGRAPVPDAVITATARADGAQLAQTTSDAQGLYQLAIPTHGAAIDVALTYAQPAYMTSTVFFDSPFDRSTDATDQRLANNAQWSDGSMGAVYGTVGFARDSTKGSINISLRTCTGAIVENVIVTVDPPPQRLIYTGSDGLPAPLPGTAAPYAFAVAFNAVPGPTTITATAPGVTFLDQQLDVLAGENVTLLVLRAVE
jgi:hypothetical protein